jgi:hypothetical protein
VFSGVGEGLLGADGRISRENVVFLGTFCRFAVLIAHGVTNSRCLERFAHFMMMPNYLILFMPVDLRKRKKMMEECSDCKMIIPVVQ